MCMHFRFLVLVYSTNTVRHVTFLIVKIEKLVVGVFLVSGVWHVGWWSLITVQIKCPFNTGWQQ